MIRRTVLALAAFPFFAGPADAQTVSRSYSYFSVGGSTIEEIDKELSRRGPQINGAGRRHPGATRMQFSTKLSFASTDRWCAIDDATVTLKAKIILPRWRQRRRADYDTRLIWDTLASDIKRHEDFHVQIAKRHARELEQTLETIGRMRDCAHVQRRAAVINQRILAKHDRAQARFDRIEAKNFEDRLLRILTYRLERIEAARRRK
ncbi:DUF922 domain-containing Zn-dependent protease [Mesorhizobium xinjiangense]|uniref:DUF922 domain-containing Zn-dependent protease n=1 Tax=Mesorhizobium xinjiangense TaxID=2678685 RepID=UPI0012EE9D07|nr:DUF922 domain-containing protein [Mesorhizobium xinjiangense]